MKLIKYITFILFVSMLWSCEKEEIETDITSNNWKVLKIKNQEDSIYTESLNSYILDFNSDTTFTINLDVNTCFSQYEIIKGENIEIKAVSCTEVCCDSEFANNLMLLLLNMTNFNTEGDELIFEGNGEIILEVTR